MRGDLVQLMADLERRGEPFVLALVVARSAPSSAQAGDAAVVTADGGFHGWLGGACTRPVVVREALAALAAGCARTVALAPDPESARRPGVATFPMTCHSGGSVEILLEPVLPAPRLVVFGGSPTARALVRLGEAMGYAVTVTSEAETSGAEPSGGTVYAVVATVGEGDEEAIATAVALAPAYLGVVASARRWTALQLPLLSRGLPEAALAAVHSPAGLDLGAKTPEEIALSILAEIVALRRAAERTATAAPAATTAEAVDPICGMTVEIAGARHRAEVDGTVYYFCCGGCRERFLASRSAVSPS